jgi:hypothetical protein
MASSIVIFVISTKRYLLYLSSINYTALRQFIGLSYIVYTMLNRNRNLGVFILDYSEIYAIEIRYSYTWIIF